MKKKMKIIGLVILSLPILFVIVLFGEHSLSVYQIRGENREGLAFLEENNLSLVMVKNGHFTRYGKGQEGIGYC